MVLAPILWCDADEYGMSASTIIFGQAAFGLGVSVAGTLVWLLE